MARGRWDLPRAKRGSSTNASYNYGHDDADSDYAESVASAAPSNYSSAQTHHLFLVLDALPRTLPSIT